MTKKGLYIVFEGAEGVGKTTQILELYKKLKEANLPVRIFREPDSLSDLTARAIRQLTQDPQYPMNTRTEVLLYNAARSQTLKIIKNCTENGIYCLVDRNYLTTLAVQYYGRAEVKDYQTINQIINFAVDGVEPDICIVLDAPVQILKERTKQRNQGERFDNLDLLMLERIRSGYLWEAKQRGYPVVFSIDSKEKVFENIWSIVQPKIKSFISKEEVSKPTAVSEILEKRVQQTTPTNLAIKPYLIKDKNSQFKITQEGNSYLQNIITNVSSNVYAFNNTLSPITVAAAMARLSRRGDDLRITLLDEFANNLQKDQKLLQRVITAYGDDSVQQLAGIHIVVENASNLLTKKLEWGRLGAYLEQSTRYIYYDQKVNNKYKYYTPSNLKKDAHHKYTQIMDQIFDLYSKCVKELYLYIEKTSKTPIKERDGAWKSAVKAQACDAARGMLPVATKSTVGMFLSGQALESLIYHLKSDPLEESRQVGNQLLEEAKKIIPVFLERAERDDRGGAFIAYRAETNQEIRQKTQKLLSKVYPDSNYSDVDLIDYYPKNELDLIPEMLYSSSQLSLREIEKSIQKISYDQKIDLFKSYIGKRLNRRHRPGRALEKARYTWDIVCDYGIFRDLQRHRMVDGLEWQDLTPRFGYDIPELIEKANLVDEYQTCFDLSLNLFSYLQKYKYFAETQYATLLGHKMRWKITYNGREAFHLHELRTSPQGHPGYRKLVNLMHQKLAEVHPLMAESMIFVNKDEDPELTRLAAERYQQYKLSNLN